MSRDWRMVLMILAGAVAAVSQVILKLSAVHSASGALRQYLNAHVLTGYCLLLGATIVSVIAYRGVDYKLGPMLGLNSYVFVMVFGAAFLKEPLTLRKLTGNFLIVIGIVIFSLHG